MDDHLRAASQDGDIDQIYTLIQGDPHILDHMDGIPFVETPVHIAAAVGHLQFATEIMRLKPSFAWKLNQQGFTPIHLALQQGQKRTVLRFIDINKDLVRVKGREGLTPLHFVSQSGETELLAEFLSACPASIEDFTVRSETALHIAVRNNQYEALQILVGWLKRTRKRGAMNLEKSILNWKDAAGNNILHIAALINDSQALRLLINSKIDLKAKNLENLTALDIAASAEIEGKLVEAGAKRSPSVTDAPKLADKLRLNITVLDKTVTFILRIREDISEGQRNALLVVAALVAAASYQSALNPPGGLYQVNAGANDQNTTSLNSTATVTPSNAGKSVMTDRYFVGFTGLNTVALLLSTLIIYILTPAGVVGRILSTPVLYFVGCYFMSMMVISPSDATSNGNYIMLCLLVVMYSAVYFLFAIYNGFQGSAQQRKIRSWNNSGGNRW